MKNIYTYLVFICLFCYACEKKEEIEEVFVHAQEPDIENPEEVFINQDLRVSINSKTDHDLYIRWNPVTGAASYEIIVNDIYVITENITNYLHRLTNLESDTEYKIAVRALSKDLHTKTSAITAKTLKSFIDETFQIKLDKYAYDFKGYTYFNRTQDGGSVFLANINRSYSYKELVKLNPKFEIEWICEIPDPGYEPYYFYTEPHIDVHELSDGSYTVTTNKYAANISSSGTLNWKTIIAFKGAYFNSSVMLPDGSIILSGYSERDRGSYTITGYYMAKLSAGGTLLWEKHFDTPDNPLKRRYLQESIYHNGKLFCCSWSDNASLVAFDVEGNMLKEYIYKHPESNNVTFTEILPSPDQSFYLAGTVNSKYYIVKTDESGEVIWENKGAYYGFISSCNTTAKNTVLFLDRFDTWLYGREIDSNGSIIASFSWHNPSSSIYIGQDEKSGRYIYATMYGDVIFINPDGYKK